MGISQIKITTLNDIVDTLKLQFYPNSMTLEETIEYNKLVDFFVSYKEDAQMVKHKDNQQRFVKVNFANIDFRVMAQSTSSFNVILQHGDFSLYLLRHGNHSNPLIKVEFRAEFLLRFGYKKAIQKVKELINNFYQNYFIKVSEIHLAKDIQGYEFSPFDFHKIKTLSKTKTLHYNDISSQHHYGNKFNGFTIGKGDELLRLYNKTLEINQNKSKSFIEVLSWQYNPDFNPNQNVWRIEFQFRRERLKYLLSENGLLDSLDNVIRAITNLWSYATQRFVHKQLSNQQIHEQLQGFKFKKDGSIKILSAETLRKRFRKAPVSIVWDSISTFEDKQAPALQKVKDIKKPERAYVENAYKALLSTFTKLNRGDFNHEDLTEILISCNKENIKKTGISLVDKARINALDYMSSAKVFYEQNGIITDGFYQYEKDLINNIKETYAILEGEPSSLVTFEEFKKRIA